jgi:RNA polymerase sigma-70 factor (ECF subfamily)
MNTDSSSVQGLTEEELIARVLKGERKCFHELVRPYERAIYITAYAVLRNQADAEDAAQETMLKVLTRLDQLSSVDKFKGWILQIALNEARSKRRQRHERLFEPLEREDEHDEEPFMPNNFADWRELPSESAERAEVREKIWKALQEIPDIYREAFLMRDVQHLTAAEAASALGISVVAVKVRLHRARLLMREKLSPVFRRRWFDRLTLLKGKNPW